MIDMPPPRGMAFPKAASGLFFHLAFRVFALQQLGQGVLNDAQRGRCHYHLDDAVDGIGGRSRTLPVAAKRAPEHEDHKVFVLEGDLERDAQG
jgi:hypothetical protein